MRYFPIFVDLKDRSVLVFGGGEAALNKVRLLSKTGAQIRVLADNAVAGIVDLAAQGGISLEPAADPQKIDLSGVALVVSSAGDPIDTFVSARAKATGIPVNVVDRTELCSFITPAIIDRGTVLAAIGTEGAAPVLARRLRARIEALLPARLGQLADLIGSRRTRLAQLAPDIVDRRRFWERVLDGPIAADLLAGREAIAAEALDRLIERVGQGSDIREGIVFLVGAGPGDPELLTLKALRVLQDADIIFHDDLVTEEILDLARRDAERVSVGKRAGARCTQQETINRQLVEAARKGLRVVRLKGGDPFVFGRGGEELEHLREAGVEVVVVPGITAALGCAAEAELPLTHRKEASRLTLLTAHRAADAEVIDWRNLGGEDATLAIYMGKASAPAISRGLIAAGRRTDTPVAILSRGTRPDSGSVAGELKDLADLVTRSGDGPALVVVGEVVRRSRPWRERLRSAISIVSPRSVRELEDVN